MFRTLLVTYLLILSLSGNSQIDPIQENIKIGKGHFSQDLLLGMSSNFQGDIAKIDSLVGFTYTTPNDSIKAYKAYFDYVEEDGATKEIITNYFLDHQDFAFKLDSKRESTYNEDHNLKSVVSYRYYDEYVPYDSYSYEYDGLELISYTKHQYDTNHNVWDPIFKYTYDNEDNSIVTLKWDDEINDWYMNRKEEETIENDILLSKQFYTYDRDSSIWKISKKHIYSYFDNGKIIHEDIFHEKNQELVFTHRNITSIGGNIHTKTYSTYWGYDTIFINEKKHEFIYNDSGNLISELKFFWDEDHFQGANGNRFTYDENGKLTSYIFYEFNDFTSEWYIDGRIYYFNSDNSTSIVDSKINSITIFPNPTVDHILIEGDFSADALITVYDESGSVIISKNQLSNQSLNVSDLPSGIYSIKIHNGNEIHSGRFVKL